MPSLPPQLKQMDATQEGLPGAPWLQILYWTLQESPQLLLSRSPVLGEDKKADSQWGVCGGDYYIAHRSLCTRVGMTGNPKMGPFRNA